MEPSTEFALASWAEQAARTGSGRGVRIAILDSGVEWSHPALQSVRRGDDLVFTQQASGSIRCTPGEGVDLFGHGTAVASLIHQIAPAAEISSFRVLGGGLAGRTHLISRAATEAIDRGYHVLNCSFGCGMAHQILHYKRWIDRAYLEGRHIVAASNNHDYRRVEWPAHFNSVIAVRSGHEDAAPDLGVRYQPGHLVEFLAPGENVDVAWKSGQTRHVTGSSFATARVTGVLARILEAKPELSPFEAKLILRALGMKSARKNQAAS